MPGWWQKNVCATLDTWAIVYLVSVVVSCSWSLCSDLTVQLESDLVGVRRAVLIGGDALVLGLVLFWIVPGIDVQRPWAPAHGHLRVTCHVEILPVSPPWETCGRGQKYKGHMLKDEHWFVKHKLLEMCFVTSYMGWGFPLASHSMTIVSLGLTMCSFIDCLMMVGGCLTAGRAFQLDC